MRGAWRGKGRSEWQGGPEEKKGVERSEGVQNEVREEGNGWQM